jgi:ParB family chromosome partitioning protein
MMLAAHEADLSRESWRRPGSQAAYYFFQLEEWGYTLSEVEALITEHAMNDTTTGTQDKASEPTEPTEPTE